MNKLSLLRAIYEAIRWDKLYEALPEVSRRQVDELFRELREALGDVAEAPEELAAKVAGGEALL